SGSSKMDTFDRWQLQHQSGYQVHSSIEEVAAEDIEVLGQSYNTRLFKEVASFQGSDERIENLFWFERSTGQLLQSRQQLAPHMPVFSITYISRAARMSQPAQQSSLAQSMEEE
ncbi:MAG: YjbF family lipoprotein, partial [Alkalimonas sp.]|nr:YjbF family lipoprotein [Alkalimonas sp.]